MFAPDGWGDTMLVLLYEDLRQRGIPYSRVHLNRLIDGGHFPPSFRLAAGGRICWDATAVDEWLQSRLNIAAGPIKRPGVNGKLRIASTVRRPLIQRSTEAAVMGQPARTNSVPVRPERPTQPAQPGERHRGRGRPAGGHLASPGGGGARPSLARRPLIEPAPRQRTPRRPLSEGF